MSANSQVLREYLVALGFKVNNDSNRAFDAALARTNRGVMALGKGVFGVATAATAMVAVFARSMEQMYYSSRKAETTVGNLKAIEYAARNIGLGGEQMRGAVEGVARAMRLNPGLQGLVESFGIKVTGRDKADVAIDLVDALRKMPFYVASQYAGLFGIDPDTLLLLGEQLDKFKEIAAARKQMAAEAGLDTEAAAAAAVEYSNKLREIQELFGILKDTAMVSLLPTFRELANVTASVLKDWTKLIRTPSLLTDGNGIGGFFRKLGQALGIAPPAGGGVELSAHTRASADNWIDKGGRRAGGRVVDGSAGSSLFERLESQYGLPMGMLDKIWAKESNRSDPRFMKSSAGAEGPFQFMPGTAKRFGVSDPYDLTQAATGAAKYLQLLLERYDGDDQLAAMAYNAGEGRIDKFLAGQGKPLAYETINYGAGISGRPVMIHQLTNIHVNGSDPESTGRAVAREQGGVNSELGSVVRNQIGAVE